MRKINRIIVHCSFTKASQNFTADDIRRWHVKDNGWSDIGYHAVICRDGTIEGGRPDEIMGAHARSHNATSLGVCLVGGQSHAGEAEFNYTFAQLIALKNYLAEKSSVYGLSDIIGHNEVSSKECPCFNVTQFVKVMLR